MPSASTDEPTPATPKASQDEYRRRLKPLHIMVLSSMLVLVVALLAIGWIFRSTRLKTFSSPQTRESKSAQIRVTGSTEAVHMQAIVAPILDSQQLSSLTVTRLAPSGARLHKGDLLVAFDRQTQMRTFVDKRDEYQKLANQVVQEQAKEEIARAKDETDLQQADSDLSKAQLAIQKIELLSRIDAEKAQQTLVAAKATLQQLRATFVAKRNSAHSAVRLLEIQRDRARQVMDHVRTNAESMEIKSPIDGVVMLNTIWKQGKMGQVQEGDQVRSGVTFMQVVDPSSMQVRALVNQEDFLSLRFGDAAQIHLDAYPDLVFPGKLVEMAPIARAGDFSKKLHSFAVVFSVSGADPRLMPDLSAAVDINLSTQAGDTGAFH